MDHFLSLDTLEAISREYGYWAVFCGILIENMGIPLPGETITLIGGFLAGSHELNVLWVWIAATSGAILGDSVGYWVGYFGGWPLLLTISRRFNLSESALESVRDRFSNNAAKAVIFGRFVALLRIFAGPLAGITQMPYLKFLVCNAIGAASWATVIIGLSYFLGRMVPLVSLIQWVSQFTGLALCILLGWLCLVWWLEGRDRIAQSE